MTYFEIRKASKSDLEKRLDEVENRINDLEFHDRWTDAESREYEEIGREKDTLKKS